MIRLWLAFIVVAVLIHFGIQAWLSMSGKAKWALTKSIFYSIIIALLTFVVMATIVILF